MKTNEGIGESQRMLLVIPSPYLYLSIYLSIYSVFVYLFTIVSCKKNECGVEAWWSKLEGWQFGGLVEALYRWVVLLP